MTQEAANDRCSTPLPIKMLWQRGWQPAAQLFWSRITGHRPSNILESDDVPTNPVPIYSNQAAASSISSLRFSSTS